MFDLNEIKVSSEKLVKEITKRKQQPLDLLNNLVINTLFIQGKLVFPLVTKNTELRIFFEYLLRFQPLVEWVIESRKFLERSFSKT